MFKSAIATINVLIALAVLVISCGNEVALIDPDFKGADDATLRLAGLGDCQQGSGTQLSAGEVRDELEAVVSGDRVSFTHKEAMFNCCLDSVSLGMETAGNVITVVETPHCENPCYCVCPYTVMGEIKDLEPGIYTLRICESFGSSEPLCEVEVDITAQEQSSRGESERLMLALLE